MTDKARDFIDLLAHFLTESDLNEAYDTHFGQYGLGSMCQPQVVKFLLKMFSDDWIPVEKELPEVGTEVIIQEANTEEQWFATLEDDGTWNAYAVDFKIDEVVAWKPKPEPYKGE